VSTHARLRQPDAWHNNWCLYPIMRRTACLSGGCEAPCRLGLTSYVGDTRWVRGGIRTSKAWGSCCCAGSTVQSASVG
jgi:hypothetical protein